MEYIIKITVTIFAAIMIWGIGVFVAKMWKSQIDPKKTIENYVTKIQPEPTSLLATRDSDTFYQNGKAVGKIHGEISEIPNGYIFKIVSDTEDLKLDQLIEFKRLHLKVVSIKNRVGMMGYADESGSGSYKSVILGLECVITSD